MVKYREIQKGDVVFLLDCLIDNMLDTLDDVFPRYGKSFYQRAGFMKAIECVRGCKNALIEDALVITSEGVVEFDYSFSDVEVL